MFKAHSTKKSTKTIKTVTFVIDPTTLQFKNPKFHPRLLLAEGYMIEIAATV